MSIESQDELQGLQAASQAVAITLKKMRNYARPGMSTQELDIYGFKLLQSFGAIPAPKKDYQFPGYTCISLNHEVCHGIPSPTRKLKEGDLINIDVSAELHGYYGDNGCSFILGRDHRQLEKLVQASQAILHQALSNIRSRVKIADVGALIDREARKRGYRVVKNICGHGIGRKLHEAPREIPCFKDKRNKGRFKKNMVIALETFISTRAQYVYEMEDGWTLSTRDNSYVAQHEHTIVVTDRYPLILTQENGI